MASIHKSAAWKKLARHRVKLARKLAKDPPWDDARRVKTFSVTLPGLHADLSRHLADAETMRLLLALAEAAKLKQKRSQLFSGALVNHTEKRAALHTLLRTAPSRVPAGLRSKATEAEQVFRALRDFVQGVQGSGRFTDVVSIGIGGSHLGPELVVEALMPLTGPKLRVHFVSNVDPMHVARTLAGLDPRKTLVIVISKTFTTQETLANARAARAWLVQALGEGAVAGHFAAVSAATDKAVEFGIDPSRVFGFWDWVGGRYSLWSAVGLPIALAHGYETFAALQKGAARMDEHFRSTPLQKNLPVLLALLGIWYADFWEAGSRAVIPYRQDLRLLVPYLQQLEMESDGKRVDSQGKAVKYATAPVVWGDTGTNGQHAFFQLLHQGTPLVPVDFIAVLAEESGNPEQQRMLLANCYAQAEALLRGRSQKDAALVSGKALAPHKTFPGGRPSTLLMLERLDADSLGMLLALYEHRTFVQACIWDINPFDQMGVELGKQLTGRVLEALASGDLAGVPDPATHEAVKRSRHE